MKKLATKKCTACNKSFPATLEYFHKLKEGKYGVRSVCKQCSSKQFKLTYIPIPKKTEKICSHCKETFPLTNEYFFTKTTKAGTIVSKNGKPLSKDSISFKSICKKCHGKEGTERKCKKIMTKHNLISKEELSELKRNNIKNSGIKRQKYPYPEYCITKTQRTRYRRILDKGFLVETYSEDWKKKWLETTKNNRKYIYTDDVIKVTPAMIHQKMKESFAPSIMANRLRLSVKDITPEILNLQKKYLSLLWSIDKKDISKNNRIKI